MKSTFIPIQYKKRAGVYMIICLKNHKRYIGSSKCVYSRGHTHFWELANNKHCNSRLQRAFNKYGINYFLFGVIEFCDLDIMIDMEQYFMDIMKPEFNIAPKASNTLGMKIKFSKKRMVEISAIRRKQALENNPMKGRTHSIITKQIISDKQKMAIKKRGGLHPNFLNASILANTGKKHTKEIINERAQKQRKLSDEQVLEILSLRMDGIYQNDIAKKFNISQRLVVRVEKGIGVYEAACKRFKQHTSQLSFV